MSKVTIKFWCTERLEYVPDDYSDDFAVNEDGEVIHIHFNDVMHHLEPHFYKFGERIA